MFFLFAKSRGNPMKQNIVLMGISILNTLNHQCELLEVVDNMFFITFSSQALLRINQPWENIPYLTLHPQICSVITNEKDCMYVFTSSTYIYFIISIE